MTEKQLNHIRKQVKTYYDEVTERAEKLEEPRVIYDVYEVRPLYLMWGRSLIYRAVGTEMCPPVGLADEVEFTRQELKLWSTVHKLEKTREKEGERREKQ